MKGIQNILRLFLILVLSVGTSLRAQDVQAHIDLYGKQIETDSLAAQSQKIADLLGSTFTIYDASFYAMTPFMGKTQEDYAWKVMKDELSKKATGNYVLLARIYDGDNARVKVHLQINPTNIQCEEAVKGAKEKLDAYAEDLSRTGEGIVGVSAEEIQLIVARRLYAKLDNICCELIYETAGRRGPNDCSDTQVDDVTLPCKMPEGGAITNNAALFYLPKDTPVKFGNDGRVIAFYLNGKVFIHDITLGYISEKKHPSIQPNPSSNNTTSVIRGVVEKYNQRCNCIFFELKAPSLPYSEFTFPDNTNIISGGAIPKLPAAGDTSDPTIIRSVLQPIDQSFCNSPKEEKIRSILIAIRPQQRSGQMVEYHDGTNTYHLDGAENIIKDNTLSDTEIQVGDWSDKSVDVRIRLYHDANGLLKVKTIGFRKDLSNNVGIPFRPADLSNLVKSKTNVFWEKYGVKDAQSTPASKSVDLNDTREYADGDDIHIDNNATFVKIVLEGTDIVKSLLKTAEVKESVYLHKDVSNAVIHTPGLVSGSVEIAAETATDLTSIAATAYDMATDKQARTDAYNSLVKLKNEVSEDLGKVMPIVKTVFVAALSGNTIDEWKEANNPETDAGRRSHLTTRGAVSLVKNALAGGSFFLKLEGLVDEVIKKVKRLDGSDLTKADLQKLSDDMLQDNSGELRKLVDEQPEVVKAWKRLVDAPDGIRLNLDILDDVSSWPASWQIRQGTVNGTIEVLDGAGTPLARIFPDRVVASGRSVIGQPGNKILNRVPPIKNMTYEVDGIDYITDNLGRVTKTSGDLDDAVRVRLGNQQIRAVDVKDGVRGTDQGGHIIGARFFGAGEQINYYPQSANLNLGAWKTMENGWADAMVAGKDVKVDIRGIYNSGSFRPDKIEVRYTIDGQPFFETFDNI